MHIPADKPLPPARVLDAYGLEHGSVVCVAGGHINVTYRARARGGDLVILQRVNRIFPADVNYDFDAVTRHLRAKAEISPALLRTRSGALWIEDDGANWRAQTHVEGRSIETLHSPDEAHEAGRVLGRFHAALADLRHEFRSVRSDPHDTARHLAALEDALRQHRAHRHYATVEPVAQAILAAARSITTLPRTPVRIVHGDPKISNVLFDPARAAALCLVDLDTTGARPISAELGDAFRSWCNPAGEDAPDAGFSLGLFEAAIGGYLAGSRDLLSSSELAAIPSATHAIGVELAARFCADALNERFFRWDPVRFPDASSHNLARAQAQLGVALAVAAAAVEMGAAIEQAARRGG